MAVYEAEIAEGLYEIASAEIQALGGKIHKQTQKDAVHFSYAGQARDLAHLGTVIAVYAVLQFDIPRPKALLGHQHWQRLMQQIRAVMTEEYQALYISAAGSESSVMQRIKSTLADETGLAVGQDEGDLWLRIRRTPKSKRGWDVLVRLSPRPLATREWRVCNMEGALNAAVARAMVIMSQPNDTDVFLNIACGSGTILVERMAHAPAKSVLGCDIANLDCARENIVASGYDAIRLLNGDGTQLPIADNSVDALCADLPFGQLVGSHAENQVLYPAVLREAARVARVGARFVIITHEVRLMEKLLREQHTWRTKHVQMITLTGLHPRIYVLEHA